MKAKVNTIEIPECELNLMKKALTDLFFMHIDLIGFYELESDLKRRHQAYLYVREGAEEKIKEDIERIDKILKDLGGLIDFIPKKDELVVLEKEDMENIKQDMITLTDQIDNLINILKAEKAGIVMGDKTKNKAIDTAQMEADKIFNKWSDKEDG